jgi:hypothetical protein
MPVPEYSHRRTKFRPSRPDLDGSAIDPAKSGQNGQDPAGSGQTFSPESGNGGQIPATFAKL